MKQCNEPIDFVITWVDGNDRKWKREKEWYARRDAKQSLCDDREERYRDWDNLQYWFRSIEKNAPWVHKIYFVTCGHLPKWLDTENPKLVIVNHKDYIPEQYLPTFNSHTIELNFHRIPDLSEHFVYFNDDVFLLKKVKPQDFFINGKPKDMLALQPDVANPLDDLMPHIYLNNTEVINEHFDMHQVLKKDRDKWFSVPKNGIKTVLENMYCSQFKMFPGFKDEHLPVPILKSTMDTIWKLNGGRLDDTCRHRFRDVRDVSQYVFRYWQMASGNFVPERLANLGAHYTISADEKSLKALCSDVAGGKYNLMCLNDADGIHSHEEFLLAKEQLLAAFESLLPERSVYEKEE